MGRPRLVLWWNRAGHPTRGTERSSSIERAAQAANSLTNLRAGKAARRHAAYFTVNMPGPAEAFTDCFTLLAASKALL